MTDGARAAGGRPGSRLVASAGVKGGRHMEQWQLLMLHQDLTVRHAELTERHEALQVALAGVERLLAAPARRPLVEGAEQSPLAAMLSSEGVGL